MRFRDFYRNGFAYKGAMLISGLFVIIGGWLPSVWMAVLIIGAGIIGLGLFYRVYTGLAFRKELVQTEEAKV